MTDWAAFKKTSKIDTQVGREFIYTQCACAYDNLSIEPKITLG